jgi:hypothetical protein
LSTNGGTSFAPVAVPSNELWQVGMQVASFDGVGLTAMTTDWMVFSSNGAGWTATSPVAHTPANIWLSATSATTFYARGQSSPTVHVVGTQSRFASVAESDLPAVYYPTLATSLVNAQAVVVLDVGNPGKTYTSASGAASFVNSTAATNSFLASPYAVINPADANTVWYGGLASDTTHLYAVHLSDGTVTEPTAPAGFEPAAMEIYSDGVGGTIERLVSSTGALVTSTNALASFSAVMPGPVGASCRTGIIASSPLDRAIVAVTCANSDPGNIVQLTYDAGANWTALRGPKYCGATQLAFTATDLIMSCLSEEPVLYALDP